MKRFFSKIVSLFAALAIIVGICPALSFADDGGKTVRVGYIDYPGFIEKQENGNYIGYGVQYLGEIAKFTSWKYEYVYGSWGDLMQQLYDGKIDLLCQAQKIPEREEKYIFSKYSNGSESSVLYTKKDNDSLFYNGFEDFSGITVALMDGSFQNQSFAEYAEKKGFSYTPIFCETEAECFKALADGRADAVAMGSLDKKTEYKVLCRFGSDPFYFITGKQNQQLMNELDNAMEEILGTEPYFAMSLFNEYYNTKESSALNLTKSEIEFIKNSDEITVGQLRNRYTFSCINPDTGELEGINEDLLDVISDRTGLRFKSVPIELDKKPVDALKNGDFQMVMGILRTENFLSDPQLSLSMCYLESTLTIVMRKGESLNPSNNYTVALKNSFQAMQEYISANYPQYTAVFYTDDDDCLQAVLDGNADLMMQNVYTMNYLMQKPKYSALEILPTTFLTEQNCMAALSDTDPRLISIMDKAIAALDAETINAAILANTTAKPYQLTTGDILFKYRSQIIVMLALLILCFVMLGNIIAARSKNEKILTEKNVQLADAVAQADRASIAKSQFLSRMSHEIRTPMNAIVGLTTIAKQHEGSPAKIDDYLTKIDSSSKVLLGIINDILDMSAIESNKLKIANDDFDIKQIITNITTIYYPQCESKGIKFIVTTNLENELFRGDSLRVSQILLNLISNAYKFTDKGGTIRLDISETTRNSKNAFIRFSVADTGAGMTEDMQERLFLPFEQENAATAQKHGGSGLGLSIMKNLVDMMHGAVDVKSQKGVGSTFTVDIPFEIIGNPEAAESENVKKLRILVVDDDYTSLDYASIVLRRIGAPFDTAKSGTKALEMIDKADMDGKAYDVVMVDWKMDEMDGIELTRRIRVNEKHKSMIIIVSAYDLNQVEDEAAVAGADHFLPKPIFQSTLFNVLMKLSNGGYVKNNADKRVFDFTGHRVLLAEDNEINSDIAVDLLAMVHMAADTAANGQIAVDMFSKAPQGTYDAILMDVNMPIMDGYEATRSIRSLNRADAKTIPIFAMTANAFTDDVSQAISAGMNGHIAKPISTDILYSTLDKAIG